MADVRPIDVVKHANDTTTAKIAFPTFPSNPSVIFTITCDCTASVPYIVDTVAPRKHNPP